MREGDTYTTSSSSSFIPSSQYLSSLLLLPLLYFLFLSCNMWLPLFFILWLATAYQTANLVTPQCAGRVVSELILTQRYILLPGRILGVSIFFLIVIQSISKNLCYVLKKCKLFFTSPFCFDFHIGFHISKAFQKFCIMLINHFQLISYRSIFHV